MTLWLIEDCCEYNTDPTAWQDKDEQGTEWYVKKRTDEIYETRKDMKERCPDNPNVIEPVEKPWEEREKIIEQLSKRDEPVHVPMFDEDEEDYYWTRFIFSLLVLIALSCFLGNLI